MTTSIRPMFEITDIEKKPEALVAASTFEERDNLIRAISEVPSLYSEESLQTRALYNSCVSSYIIHRAINLPPIDTQLVVANLDETRPRQISNGGQSYIPYEKQRAHERQEKALKLGDKYQPTISVLLELSTPYNISDNGTGDELELLGTELFQYTQDIASANIFIDKASELYTKLGDVEALKKLTHLDFITEKTYRNILIRIVSLGNISDDGAEAEEQLSMYYNIELDRHTNEGLSDEEYDADSLMSLAHEIDIFTKAKLAGRMLPIKNMRDLAKKLNNTLMTTIGDDDYRFNNIVDDIEQNILFHAIKWGITDSYSDEGVVKHITSIKCMNAYINNMLSEPDEEGPNYLKVIDLLSKQAFTELGNRFSLYPNDKDPWMKDFRILLLSEIAKHNDLESWNAFKKITIAGKEVTSHEQTKVFFKELILNQHTNSALDMVGSELSTVRFSSSEDLILEFAETLVANKDRASLDRLLSIKMSKSLHRDIEDILIDSYIDSRTGDLGEILNDDSLSIRSRLDACVDIATNTSTAISIDDLEKLWSKAQDKSGAKIPKTIVNSFLKIAIANKSLDFTKTLFAYTTQESQLNLLMLIRSENVEWHDSLFSIAPDKVKQNYLDALDRFGLGTNISKAK